MVNLMNILIPLYMYPSGCTVSNLKNDACAWAPFFQAIEQNPSYIHTIVINPASGPGALYSYPDDGWKIVINKLNSYNNTRLIGYVDSWSDANIDTGDAPRRPKIEPSTYIPQITTYVNWANLTGYDLHMDGVFVDDMVADTPARLQYYQTYANNVKSTFPATYVNKLDSKTYSYEKYIVVNPGTTIDCGFYGNVSSIVVFEAFYNQLANAPFKTAAAACTKAKHTVIIHDFVGSNTDQQQVCDDMGETYRVGNLYITNQTQIDSQNINPYDKRPKDWPIFASSVTATDSWIAAHPQWYNP